jgi:flagellar hook-length control protein FliK
MGARQGLAGLFSSLLGQALQGRNEAGPSPETAAASRLSHGQEAKQSAKPASPSAQAPTQSSPHEGQVSSRAKARLAEDEAGVAQSMVAEHTRPLREGRRGADPRGTALSEAARGPGESTVDEETQGTRKAGQRTKVASLDGSDEARSRDATQALASATKSDDRHRRVGAKDEAVEARAIDDDRSRSRSREDPALASRLSVIDQRRSHAKREAASGDGAAAAEIAATTGTKEDGARPREILLDLSKTATLQGNDRSVEAKSPEAGVKGDFAAVKGDFATMLADRLRDSGNTEIVQSARIVLKDGDSGSIRMRLNPPELGNVKIELNLADNSISGKIVVESDAAKTAFEKGLAELMDAFMAGGFESAKLEVSVGSGNAGHGGPGGQGPEPPRPFWSERSRSAAFDPAPGSMPSMSSRAERAVDILV